ncbi:ESX secretion-associated protein EspG [Saccharopolyspora sp. NPDC002578]
MTAMTGADFVLSTAEFDLLGGELGVRRAPFPLAVASVGASVPERAARTAEAYRALHRRGLANGGALAARPAALLRMLVDPPAAVHHAGCGDGPLPALAATDGRTGVLGRIVGDELRVIEIRPTELAVSIVGVLPRGAAAPGRALRRIPREALPVVTGEPGAGGRAELVRAGMSERNAVALLGLVARRRGGGSFGVVRGARAAGSEVSWFDTHRGRYLVAADGPWLSIAPADDQRIARRVAELMSTVA